MAQDYFAILGLPPGRHSPRVITSCFRAERARLLRELDEPGRHSESRRQLEDLYLAYTTLSDPRRREEYLRNRDAPGDSVETLRSLIAASLEGGLLRYSRRQAILDRGRELGINDFHTQLLIAQVQFGDQPIVSPPGAGPARREDSRAWARVAGVGVLALAMFLLLVHWLGS